MVDVVLVGFVGRFVVYFIYLKFMVIIVIVLMLFGFFVVWKLLCEEEL